MKFQPLTELESQVYSIMQKYLKTHKQFDLKSLLPTCFRLLGSTYSEVDITKAATSLIEKRYFIEGTTLTRDDIAGNLQRKNILQFIQINPGAYNRQIRRELNLGSNEFNWHMGMLEKFGFIKKVTFDQHSFGYFENKSYMEHEFDLYLLQNEKIKLILDYLEHTPSTLSNLAREINMHYSTVQKHLQVLEERELVIGKEEGKHRIYYLNPEMRIKLQKIVNGQIFIDFAETV